MANVNRGRSSNGGRTHTVQNPTFTESLLMEILYQLIPCETDDTRIKMILARAGFTDEEIKERMS
jgi:hypothetical protein